MLDGLNYALCIKHYAYRRGLGHEVDDGDGVRSRAGR